MKQTIFIAAVSKIHGVGMFSTVNLPVGMAVPFKVKYAERASMKQPSHGFESKDRDYGYFPEEPFCYMNDSETPNAMVIGETWQDQWYLKIIKPVKTGEEITFNYDGEQ